MKILLTTLVLLLAQAPAQTSDIAGRVLKPDNSPAPGMSVEILQLDSNNEGVREWRPVEGEATTDAEGAYRISGVRPGQYYLRVIKRPPLDAGGTITASSVDWIPTTYFPGTLNAALASSFTVAAGQSLTRDVPIPQTNPYTVSGRIVNSLPDMAGRPIQLALIRRDFGAPVESQSGKSLETLRLPAGGDGKFEIRGVPSGSYELVATLSTGDVPVSGQSWIAKAAFEVADQDVDGVSATLQSPALK